MRGSPLAGRRLTKHGEKGRRDRKDSLLDTKISESTRMNAENRYEAKGEGKKEALVHVSLAPGEVKPKVRGK